MIKELPDDDMAQLEAIFELGLKLCRKARLKLQPVSTGSNKKKKVLHPDIKSKVLIRFHKNIKRPVSS